MFKCRFRKKCELYDEDGCTCNQHCDRTYCGKYRELSGIQYASKVFVLLLLGVFIISLASASSNLYRSTSYGDSMYPYIKNGSSLMLMEIDNTEKLEVGDIVQFNYTGLIFKYENYLHRIIKIGHDNNGWYARTKGDNNFFRDLAKLRSNNISHKLIKINGDII